MFCSKHQIATFTAFVIIMINLTAMTLAAAPSHKTKDKDPSRNQDTNAKEASTKQETRVKDISLKEANKLSLKQASKNKFKRKEIKLNDVRIKDDDRQLLRALSLQSLNATTEEGYEYIPGHGIYKLYLERTTWATAYFRCKHDGAHLAVINSPNEAVVLATLFQTVPACCDPAFTSVFVGFHDQFVSRKFVTVDGFGSSLKDSGYWQFAPGEPNNPDSENCGGLTRKGLLMDLKCDAELFFICEKVFV